VTARVFGPDTHHHDGDNRKQPCWAQTQAFNCLGRVGQGRRDPRILWTQETVTKGGWQGMLQTGRCGPRTSIRWDHPWGRAVRRIYPTQKPAVRNFFFAQSKSGGRTDGRKLP